jgi:hypothetical protein
MAKKSTTGNSGKTAGPRKATTRAAGARPPRTARRGNGAARNLAHPTLEPTVLTHEQIARRAYQLWQQTGNPDESHNWAEAERQLRSESGVA